MPGNDLTNFESEVHAKTRNANAVNLSERFLKKIRETTSSEFIFGGF